ISLGRARLLACEAMVIPSVFDYAAGEAIELGRAKRLPNHALRRKLELEQPGGCAWSGCRAPIQWTEAHHITHWVDGGATVAENLILLCRFHHGRIHTPGWTITKTGPGQALIVHHDGHADTDADLRCGCADWRTDTDLDHAFAGDVANVFPTGLYPDEWAETLKPDLAEAAEATEHARLQPEIRAARAKLRTKFAAPATATTAPGQASPAPTPTTAPTPAPDTDSAPAPADRPEAEQTATSGPETGTRSETGTDQAMLEPELASLPVLELVTFSFLLWPVGYAMGHETWEAWAAAAA